MPGAIATAYVKLIPTFDKQLSSTISKQLGQVDGKSAGSKTGKLFSNGVTGAIGGLKNEMTSRFSAMSVAVGNIMANAVTSAASTAANAVGNLISTAFNGFADYEQLSGGIKKLFVNDMGDASQIVMQNASRAFETAGMSVNQYMEQVSGFSAALVNSLGGDTVEAANRADVAMRAISDNVNTFGTDMASVQTAFQGFAKQNYTMLDNLKLGYGGTKTEMERLIADANEWGAANGGAADLTIDSFADIVTAIDQIQKKQGIWNTTSEEAMKTVSGSLGMLKGAWTNILSSFGRADADWNQLARDLEKSLTAVFDNVVPLVGRIASNIIEHAPELFAGFGETVRTSLLPQLQTAFDNVMAGIDLGEAGPVIDEIVGHFAPIGENLGIIFEKLGPIIEDFGLAALNVLDKVLGLIENVVDYLAHWDEKMDELAHDEELIDQINRTDDAVYAMNQEMGRTPRYIRTTVEADTSQAVDAIRDLASRIASLGASSMLSVVAGYIGRASGGLSRESIERIPRHADGGMAGIANRATLTNVGWVGEAGAEAIIPLTNRRYVRPFAQAVASEMGVGGSTTNYNLYIDGAQVNSDSEIQAVMYSMFQTVKRKEAMYFG